MVDEQLVLNVGRNLRKLREELNLSLRQLGEKVGVSASTIQKIEHNHISPTLETILKIARGLGKDLQFFLDPEPEHTTVVFFPQAQRRRIDPPDVRFSIEILTEGLSDQQFSALLLSIPPGGTRGHLRHQGEELQHCLCGTVALTIQGKQYLMRAGDTVHFKSDRMHKWVNVGNVDAQLLLVCSPPLHIGRGAVDR